MFGLSEVIAELGQESASTFTVPRPICQDCIRLENISERESEREVNEVG